MQVIVNYAEELDNMFLCRLYERSKRKRLNEPMAYPIKDE